MSTISPLGSANPEWTPRVFGLALVVQHELYRVRTVVCKPVFEINLLMEFAGPIGGAIIYRNQFRTQTHRLLRHSEEDLHNCLSIVVDRNDNGNRAELQEICVLT